MGFFRVGALGALGDTMQGIERILGSTAGDTLVGGDGIDGTLDGNSGNDLLYDYNGDSFLFGAAGTDTLSGNDGNDTLFGGTEADKLYGGRGDDTLDGGAGGDTITGGEGFDTVDYSSETVAIDIGLGRIGTGGSAAGDRLNTIERLIGTDFGDSLVGAGSFAITLEGGAGDDTLFDYGGASRLIGGRGNDTITGGTGADVMAYEDRDFGRDLIYSWEDGIDRIDLRGSGLVFTDFVKITTPQGTRLDWFDGSATLAIHFIGVAPANITQADFL